MAIPRIFVSSTYYDLKHIRQNLTQFIDEMGYDSVLFENGDIPFAHDKPLDKSCYGEIEHCTMMVLIIGGHYGSPTSEARRKIENKEIDDKAYAFYNSITSEEYRTAHQRDIPIFIFIERQVAAEYQTYKINKDADIKYAHVDSKNIFLLIDDIYKEERNNLIYEFSCFDDIESWLKSQWAGIFASLLQKQSEASKAQSMAAQLESLQATVNTLKSYSETIVKSVVKQDSQQIIDNLNKELVENERKIQFAMNRYVAHIVGDHKTDLEKVMAAFAKASSLDTLQEEIDKISVGNKKCPMLLVAKCPPRIIQNARTSLGLPPFSLPPQNNETISTAVKRVPSKINLRKHKELQNTLNSGAISFNKPIGS